MVDSLIAILCGVYIAGRELAYECTFIVLPHQDCDADIPLGHIILALIQSSPFMFQKCQIAGRVNITILNYCVWVNHVRD